MGWPTDWSGSRQCVWRGKNAGKIGKLSSNCGAVAQLGERIVRNDEVVGSIPTSSTKSLSRVFRLRSGFRQRTRARLLRRLAYARKTSASSIPTSSTNILRGVLRLRSGFRQRTRARLLRRLAHARKTSAIWRRQPRDTARYQLRSISFDGLANAARIHTRWTGIEGR